MAKKIPMRMCVGCREMKEKRSMVRVLRAQDGTFCIDETGKKNGRGAYICRNPQCLSLAIKNHGLERSFQSHIPKETAVKLQEKILELEGGENCKTTES